MNSQGESYTAELNGPAVAVQGDAGATLVAVIPEGANGLRETMTRGKRKSAHPHLAERVRFPVLICGFHQMAEHA